VVLKLELESLPRRTVLRALVKHLADMRREAQSGEGAL
jgi:hypothetical protein